MIWWLAYLSLGAVAKETICWGMWEKRYFLVPDDKVINKYFTGSDLGNILVERNNHIIQAFETYAGNNA